MNTPIGELDLETAYFAGLRSAKDLDLEVAQDLGYAMTPEDFKVQVECGMLVRQLTEKAALSVGRMCGDCCVEVLPGTSCPPGHLSVSPNGNGRSQG